MAEPNDIGQQISDAIADANERADAAENENSELRQSVVELDDEISSQAEQIDDIYEEIERWRANLEDQERTLQQHSHPDLQERITGLEQQIQELRTMTEANQDPRAPNSSQQPQSPEPQPEPLGSNPPTPEPAPDPTQTPPSSAPLPANPADADAHPVPARESKFRLT